MYQIALLAIAMVMASDAAPASALTPLHDTHSGSCLRYSPGWTLWKGEHPRGGTLRRKRTEGGIKE
jgi:hypothetical protein